VNPEGGKNELKDRDYHTNVDFECLLTAEIARAKETEKRSQYKRTNDGLGIQGYWNF
jgi:hypothetical protein